MNVHTNAILISAIYGLCQTDEFIFRTACLMVWPDGDPSISLLDHCYQIVFFLVTYVIPMVGLSITYCHLGSVLWTKNNHNHQEQNNNNKIKDKRKVVEIFLKNIIYNLLSNRVLSKKSGDY